MEYIVEPKNVSTLTVESAECISCSPGITIDCGPGKTVVVD